MTIPQTILVATDFGPCSDRAVEDAFDLAFEIGAKVHLVHAFELPNIPEGASMAAEAIEEARETAERKMRDIVTPRRGSGLLGEVQVRMGEPRSIVLQAAKQLGADLIVLGTHGRRGLKRLVVGSVAESVLRGADVPVLVTRSTPEA